MSRASQNHIFIRINIVALADSQCTSAVILHDTLSARASVWDTLILWYSKGSTLRWILATSQSRLVPWCFRYGPLKARQVLGFSGMSVVNVLKNLNKTRVYLEFLEERIEEGIS